MDLGLRGRTAIVTGASKGIGFAIAHSLAAEGCALHLVSRDQTKLKEAAAHIRAAGHDVTVMVHALDLSRSESVATL